MLKKELRIKTGKDYKKIYKQGKRIAGKYIIVYIKKNDILCNRFGIVTSKKVGNAVKRNQVKRRIRAIAMNNMDRLDKGNDIVVISRQNSAKVEYKFMEKDFLIVMRKAGLC